MPVYTLFGDKRGLLNAMHEEGFRRLDAKLAAVRPTDDPLADLIALGLAYREAALASPHLYGLMFGRTPAEDQPREAADATYGRLTEAVTRCRTAGVFRDEPGAERVALHLWSVVHGMVSLELNEHIPPAGLFPEALRFAVDPFLAVTDSTGRRTTT
ncbi:TetR-like C-terminal domain-containing protein [Paractinoplanes lichenicola]|uniref:WHG domain-containing protein n=1 Tax=Paractinoplanes lichenicola TaxID=2802976 RepID=A0ABS1VEW9_9ACTN|nr:TetR-like C-terminal domain-containing protein [Actinoplanes lichenicola]MBL7253237.1 WHG domain-containing protein [Actinoplanes lichenicola]